MTISATLSESTIETVKSTVPVLREHGGDIILKFYDLLFERYPSVRSYFNTDRQRGGASSENGLPTQVARLASAVMAYATFIDRIEKIVPVVRRICHRHVSRGVLAPQYDAVGECLLAAISETLGDAATEEIMTAWTEAYGFLANTFIEMEKDIQKTMEEKAGYAGFVEMEVTEVDRDDVTLLSLVPKNYAVPEHKAGQFVAIKVTLENGDETTTSMNIYSDGGEKMVIKVPESEERASKILLASEVGRIINVSVPCGEVK